MTEDRSKKTTKAGIVLGIGMGGFVDGILLHTIFEWHHMVSNWVPPTTIDAIHTNMLWDGLFHAFSWTITLIGILMLWRDARNPNLVIPSLWPFLGQLILGFGLFNLVEGIIDHHILAIHYVRQVPNYAVYNWTFLAVGGVLACAIGWGLMRSEQTLTD
ncbi:DUF2243 domain-containing protein [Chroococcus sp. FPU101]|uniref:DUF2243 domain-containing protein n=1 Tax=Chroococcus sp. FPU101 TaxID=1974212 RepID=UPI001A8E0F61|nr:DUF2243 domain-containing protein [Chroococcus sp. FPU101]GFE70697.1 hypothetical protein CFPU101_33070 [Chroococcus sp. FPU101]